jgi:hypothetical protein
MAMAALLVAAPSPEGGGGGQRGPRGQAPTSLVMRGSEQLGPNGLSGAGHKRRRHETNERHRKCDERQQRRGTKDEKGETGDDKGADNTAACRGKRATAVEMAVQATAVMTAAMAVLAQRRAGQGQGDWRRPEGGGSDLVQSGLRAKRKWPPDSLP